jgi:rhodanese-related sulfurtransferase
MFRRKINPARLGPTELESAAVSARMARDEIKLVEVRRPNETAVDCIPGALAMPYWGPIRPAGRGRRGADPPERHTFGIGALP